MNISKGILITLLIGMLLIGGAVAFGLLGPNIKKLRKERKALFEQLDQKLEENEELREDILKERNGWIRLVDILEQKLIIIDDRIADKKAALEEHNKHNNETLDSLTNIPDSLHQQFLSEQFGIKFD